MNEYDNLFYHKLSFSDVLKDLERINWKDFDFHRIKYITSLNKIKNINWYEVDKEKYEKLFVKDLSKPTILRSSRYGHYTYKKCFPSSSTCYECYKYFCPCCDDGTNSIYGESCMNKRCSSTINKHYSDIFNITSTSKYVYMYTTSKDTCFLKPPSLCSREIYGIV